MWSSWYFDANMNYININMICNLSRYHYEKTAIIKTEVCGIPLVNHIWCLPQIKSEANLSLIFVEALGQKSCHSLKNKLK